MNFLENFTNKYDIFAPTYAIFIIPALKEKIFSKVENKASVWWRYIDDTFFI